MERVEQLPWAASWMASVGPRPVESDAKAAIYASAINAQRTSNTCLHLTAALQHL